MRIFDLYSKVASLPDGEYFFVKGTEELDFEETSEKYRFFCAMMQSDDWELLQSKNKKSENKNV